MSATTLDRFALDTDDVAGLGLTPELDDRLYDAMDGDYRHEIRRDIEAGIALRRYAVDPTTGVRIAQSRADVVAAVLSRYAS